MGSFNTTCMVTQQTIVPGADVIILPIHQQTSYQAFELLKDNKEISQFGLSRNNCYPTSSWGYAGPMFTGQYDDFGRFELSDSVENHTHLISFFNHLLSSSYSTKPDENDRYVAFDMASLYTSKKEYSFSELHTIWNRLFEVTQDNRLFISVQNHPVNLQFAVIHRAAADYLIEYVAQQKSRQDISYEQKTYFKNYIQKRTEHLIKVFAEKKVFNEILDFFSFEIISLSGFCFGEQEDCTISSHYDIGKLIRIEFEDFMAKNEGATCFSDTLIDNLFNLFKTQIDHRYLHTGLDYFNIRLSPMVFSPQDYDNSLGKNYAKMIRSVSSQINKDIKEKKYW